jgi:Apea-like HEPN
MNDIVKAKGAVDNFVTMMNVSGVVGGQELQIIPDHVLRRAGNEEIRFIKGVLDQFYTGPLWSIPNPWESRQLAGGVIEQLPTEEWKYFVIAFQGGNQNMIDLEYAFVLCPWEIKVGFTVIQRSAYHAGRLYEMLDPNAYTIPEMMEITQSQIEEVASIFRRIQECGHKSLDVRRTASQIQDLDALPTRSNIKFLGYFAILESLLVHEPKGTDPYESITRQVKQKLALLDNRWDPRMDFSIFGEVSAETIWGKMYDYRSSLAHGNEPDFNKNLKILKDRRSALALLRFAVKAIARQALLEPQLVADLRNC